MTCLQIENHTLHQQKYAAEGITRIYENMSIDWGLDSQLIKARLLVRKIPVLLPL